MERNTKQQMRKVIQKLSAQQATPRWVVMHRPNCIPASLSSSLLPLRWAPLWQCGDGDGENLVASVFGSSPGDADVKSGSAERARDGASCGASAPAGVRHSGALAG